MRIINILLIVIFILLTSCDSKDNKYLKKNLENWHSSVDYFLLPITLVNSNENQSKSQDDTMYHLVTYPGAILHNMTNMHLDMDYKDILYKTLVGNNMRLVVDSVIFDRYFESRVLIDRNIDSLYNSIGIIGILNKYLDEDGWLVKYCPIERYHIDSISFYENGVEMQKLFLSDQEISTYDWHGKGINVDYIVYLASMHNIYFWKYDHLPDEYVGYFINIQQSDYNQLKGLKLLQHN